mmetsp:Transcript_101133/g.292455  ORF Transcript_101133/g.292455 Transcript_101133/m.292455 type:complete len:231 (-) Transcript_101133:126-818(-)
MENRSNAPVSCSSAALPRLRVQHVVTSIVPEVMPIQGYHSSVLVGNIEYTFSCDGGVVISEGPESHEDLEAETTYIDLGVHAIDFGAFEAAILPHFEDGTYDLLRKNCNSFTDAAIQFLTGGRMDPKFRQLESIGKVADKYMSVVQVFSGGAYEPNALADGFQLERTIRAMRAERRRARSLQAAAEASAAAQTEPCAPRVPCLPPRLAPPRIVLPAMVAAMAGPRMLVAI